MRTAILIRTIPLEVKAPLKRIALLLPLGLLVGCTETPVPKAVETVSQPQQVAQIDEHRYVMNGSPDKVALLVDTKTGKVWKYEGDGFKPIPVQDAPPSDDVVVTRRFDQKSGKIVDIPVSEQHASSPGTIIRHYNPNTGKIE